ncbi:S-adenosylmethionine synthetase, partial [Candidatus Kaiserbacteria bacterium]|nr:S-adenosylmethionine synthetase [Candidatus Kaiserbacteria bacterium]
MTLRFLTVTHDFRDPAILPIEIVERKGVGHPDSLADALANEVSVHFSKYCLDRFGIILHHNVDKLYIGAGNFRTDFGSCERIQPIRVSTNGRLSNRFGDEEIDIASLQREAVEGYLFRVLPALGAEDV